MTSSKKQSVRLRKAKVAQIMSATGFPLMSAQDIAAELNRDGSCTNSTSVSATLMGLRVNGIVCKRNIPKGIFELTAMRWAYHHPRGWGPYHGYYPKRNYWFLTSRANEVYPLGAERLQKRDERR